ncbi:MAG: class I SAM-dependent methyltransferase [Geobacteraceae bacterium]|nr:class I SAM-dependent methyltransferase [Geobacteraceae bacterium]
MHLDFFSRLPKTTRGNRVDKRLKLTVAQVETLKQYGKEYFDGETGYGGYFYDGRWKPVAEEMIEHYKLTESSRVLEVGCAKGYLMYEFYRLGITNVHGCDISEYAISNVPKEIAGNFRVMGADKLDYPDSAFDLVISIDCINNLDSVGVDRAILEMMRVSRRDVFMRVGSYRTVEEYENIKGWGVTSLTFDSEAQWLTRFKRLNYSGDYYLRFMELLK